MPASFSQAAKSCFSRHQVNARRTSSFSSSSASDSNAQGTFLLHRGDRGREVCLSFSTIQGSSPGLFACLVKTPKTTLQDSNKGSNIVGRVVMLRSFQSKVFVNCLSYGFRYCAIKHKNIIFIVHQYILFHGLKIIQNDMF